MKPYPIAVEVSGPLAMWARPDTGGAPTSYPAPTWSAAKGLLESVAFLSSGHAWLHPTRVEVCRRKTSPDEEGRRPGGEVRFQRYATNYAGPLRKELNVKNGATMQVFATVLADVCYRIHAEVRGEAAANGRNPRHHLQEMFLWRMERGKAFRTPALGWREFTCDYWGAFRDGWEVDDRLNLDIPSMLDKVWSREMHGRYVSRFRQDVRVEKGVLTYDE